MKKKDLNKILNLVVNEEYGIAKSNIIKMLKEETNSLKQKELDAIEQDKDMIKAEETYEKTADINAIAGQIAANDVSSGNLDLLPEDPTNASSVDKDNVDPNDVNYRFNDIKSDIEVLKKKFDELMNKKDELPSSVEEEDLSTDLEEPAKGELSEDEDSEFKTVYSISWGSYIDRDLWKRLQNISLGGQLVTSKGTQKSGYVNYEIPNGSDDNFKTRVKRVLDMFDPNGVVKVSQPMELKMEDIEKEFNNIFENDIIDVISEDYKLTPVKKLPNKDGEFANGETIRNDHESVFANTKEEELDLGGTPIEITGEDASGYGLEKSPEVHDSGIENASSSEFKSIPKDGDPDAILNSKKNIGTLDSQSPIPGNQG